MPVAVERPVKLPQHIQLCVADVGSELERQARRVAASLYVQVETLPRRRRADLIVAAVIVAYVIYTVDFRLAEELYRLIVGCRLELVIFRAENFNCRVFGCIASCVGHQRKCRVVLVVGIGHVHILAIDAIFPVNPFVAGDFNLGAGLVCSRDSFGQIQIVDLIAQERALSIAADRADCVAVFNAE